MLDSLITNKTRLKLLFKFFLNNQNSTYLRGLEQDFGESTNAIRVELNRFEKAELLISNFEGNKKFYKANVLHPLYSDINSIVQKTVGLDKIVDKVISHVGGLKEAYLTGDLAKGNDSNVIDLLLVGDMINSQYIYSLVEEAEKIISRRIRFFILTTKEKNDFYKGKTTLLLWKA